MKNKWLLVLSLILVSCETPVEVKKIKITNSVDNVDTYTIYFTDGSTKDYTITNKNANETNKVDPYEAFKDKYSWYTASSDEFTNDLINNTLQTKIDLHAKNNKKNIIFFIGDGMGNNEVDAVNSISSKPISFTNFEMYIQSNTNSLDSNNEATVTTDSAAGGTALATGSLTLNGYVAKDKDGNDLETLLDVAHANGYKTGVITTDKLYGATPASFSGHSTSRDNTAEIATSQATSNVDYLMGYSAETYKTNYKELFETNGYHIYDKLVDGTDYDKVLYSIDLVGNGSTYSFSDCVANAINFLNKDGGPYVLVAEEAHIDKYSHSNDFNGMVTNLKELDKGVNFAINYTKGKDDTIILVTADHETGDLEYSNENIYENSYIDEFSNKKVYYKYNSTGHTNKTVGVYIYNLGIDMKAYSSFNSSDLVKNIDICNMLKELIKEN